jgi:iron-sulfur cluster assembly accessory protein
MFSVSEKAGEMITEFFKGRQEARSIRVLLQGGGCSGYALGLAMDESTPDDEVFEQGGIKYVVEKGLLQEAQPIVVDFMETPHGSGFQVQSNLKRQGSCSSCSSCSSC